MSRDPLVVEVLAKAAVASRSDDSAMADAGIRDGVLARFGTFDVDVPLELPDPEDTVAYRFLTAITDQIRTLANLCTADEIAQAAVTTRQAWITAARDARARPLDNGARRRRYRLAGGLDFLRDVARDKGITVMGTAGRRPSAVSDATARLSSRLSEIFSDYRRATTVIQWRLKKEGLTQTGDALLRDPDEIGRRRRDISDANFHAGLTQVVTDLRAVAEAMMADSRKVEDGK